LEARTQADIPINGGLLAFVGGLSKCIVVDYAFAGRVPRLAPVAVIDDPRSAFDFWTAIDTASMTPLARNRLKAVIASGHKLIAHGQTLIHVDRRTEADVFGPSIDTLVMAEILAAYLSRAGEHVSRVLEVGSGSGMLSAIVAKYASALQELFAIDLQFQAVACTNKNLKINGFPSTAAEYLIKARFEPTIFTGSFAPCVPSPSQAGPSSPIREPATLLRAGRRSVAAP
jgi:hypothetical protein